jgi:hypothetical protein
LEERLASLEQNTDYIGAKLAELGEAQTQVLRQIGGGNSPSLCNLATEFGLRRRPDECWSLTLPPAPDVADSRLPAGNSPIDAFSLKPEGSRCSVNSFSSRY